VKRFCRDRAQLGRPGLRFRARFDLECDREICGSRRDAASDRVVAGRGCVVERASDEAFPERAPPAAPGFAVTRELDADRRCRQSQRVFNVRRVRTECGEPGNVGTAR